MILTRRETLLGFAALSVIPTQSRATVVLGSPGLITPEQFGAAGDGRTNDTAAFAKMAELVNRQGGGVIALRPVTYIVGLQEEAPRSAYAYMPASIMDFVGCTGPLTINGNGARFRCSDGLRFGTFNPKNGTPTRHAQPHYGPGELASPYFAMIRVEGCSGPVSIEDLELDGNLAGLQIGGPWGDTGWQIPCLGLTLKNNIGDEHVSQVFSHHHAQDGFLIDGLSDRKSVSVLADCTSEYNGRQGCSVVGGRNYTFRNSRFRHTGKAGLMSAPGAGIDIEAEGEKTVRNLRFESCEFSNNAGVGLLADQGDSEAISFEDCRFIGTTSWAAWPNKPRFSFNNCEFVGSIVNACGHADPDLATQFRDCLFRDDPSLSPTGHIYDAANRHPIADLPFARNVLFERCRFKLTHRAVLPWSANGPIYQDCIMSQTETKTAYPRGIYKGTNRIDGPVDLYGSVIQGELTVNGRVVPRNG